jgi:hypothetical protein
MEVSLSSFASCESFVFGAKIRKAFLLGKVPSEWPSLVFIQDALCKASCKPRRACARQKSRSKSAS